MTETRCPSCRGSKTCGTCKGDGKITVARKKEVMHGQGCVPWLRSPGAQAAPPLIREAGSLVWKQA